MELLIGALFLAIWQSILFKNQNVGLSAILFVLPVLYITFRLLKGKIENKKALLISIPIVLLSITYFIFDNTVFKIINMIVIPLLYVIMIITATSNNQGKSMIFKIILMLIQPINYIGEVVKKGINLIFTKEKEEGSKEKHNIVKAVFFTIVIALIVIALLSSADSEFANLFGDIFDNLYLFSIPELVKEFFSIIIPLFYFAGFFMNMLDKDNGLKEFDEEEPKKKDGFTIYMMITALNVIYLLFCFIQIKSLFTIENIKYSSYARQGFFQLMVVSLINIVMILKATDKNLKETQKQTQYKKIICIMMLIFTLIIIISSFARMTIYQQNYGNTRLRILVDFTLITEMILLIPTAMYILKENINLMKVYFIIVVSMYCLVNFINIDYIIAKNNIDRYIETGKIDVDYLKRLDNTDTIEQLMRLHDTKFKYTSDNDYPDRSLVLNNKLDNYLASKRDELNEKHTLAEFNLSRLKAKKVLEKFRYN